MSRGSRAEAAPDEIALDGCEPFPLAKHLIPHHGFPVLDAKALDEWLQRAIPEPQRQRAWERCERAWCLHFRDALGPKFRYDEAETAVVISSLEERVARATLDYMQRTLRRVTKVLEGIAQVPSWGKDLLIVFDDEESYYHYVSYYYPEKGEFAFSGGMFIHGSSGHFVTVRADLRAIEPTIAHEMTHGVLGHLPLPLWLNEGIAVNTEARLAGRPPGLYTPEQMHARHQGFWGDEEIQQFWSGHSFGRTDDGNSLSYDLARIIVEQLGKDWEAFRRFVLAAHRDDGGEAAAHEHLGMGLGELAAALLEREFSAVWSPAPDGWPRESATEA